MVTRALFLCAGLVVLLLADARGEEPLPQFAVRRLGTPRFAPGERIADVGLSRDGKYFVTMGMGDAQVFDREGRLVQAFPAESFSSCTYGGGRYLTIAGRNTGAPPGKLESQVELKHIETGKTDKTLGGFSYNIQAVTSSDDKLLAVVDHPNMLHLIDAASGSELDKVELKLEHAASNAIVPQKLRFAPDNSALFIQYQLGHVKVIAIKDGKLGKLIYEQGETSFGPLAISPSGKRLATLVKDEGIVVRELPANKPLFTLDTKEFRGSILGGCFIGEDKLALCAADSTIRIYPLEGLDPKPLRLYTSGRHVNCLAFDPVGRRLVSGGMGKLRFLNAETGDAIPLPGLGEVYEPAASIAVSRNEQWLALQGQLGHTFLWDLDSGQLAMRTKDPPAPATHYDPHVMPHRLAFSSDNKWLVSGSSHLGTTAQVLDLSTGKVAKEVSFRWPVMALALSPDDSLAAASSRQKDLIVFRRETGETVVHFEKFEGARHIEFTSDGKTVVALRGSDVAYFNVEEGTESLTVQPLTLHATAMTLVPGTREVVLAAQNRTLERKNLDTGKSIWSRDGEPKPMTPGPQPQNTYADLAASRDGKYLAAAGRDGTIGIFSLADGKPQGELKGHLGPVRSLAWSPASATKLYSGGGDSTVIEWDVDQLIRSKK